MRQGANTEQPTAVLDTTREFMPGRHVPAERFTTLYHRITGKHFNHTRGYTGRHRQMEATR